MTLIQELHQVKPKSIAPMIESQKQRARDGGWSWRRPRPPPPPPLSPSAWPRPWCKSAPPAGSLSYSFSARSKIRKQIQCVLRKDIYLLCVDIWNDFSKSLEGIVEPVHPLPLPGVGHVPPVLHDGRRRWVEVLLSPSLALLLGAHWRAVCIPLWLLRKGNFQFKEIRMQKLCWQYLQLAIFWTAYLCLFTFVCPSKCVCFCFYVTAVKCVSDCHVTRQSILQRMRCLRYDGDLRSVDGYIRKIWEDDRPFWNIRADISRSRLALSGEYYRL